jgi:hypothetical protein
MPTLGPSLVPLWAYLINFLTIKGVLQPPRAYLSHVVLIMGLPQPIFDPQTHLSPHEKTLDILQVPCNHLGHISATSSQRQLPRNHQKHTLATPPYSLGHLSPMSMPQVHLWLTSSTLEILQLPCKPSRASLRHLSLRMPTLGTSLVPPRAYLSNFITT